MHSNTSIICQLKWAPSHILLDRHKHPLLRKIENAVATAEFGCNWILRIVKKIHIFLAKFVTCKNTPDSQNVYLIKNSLICSLYAI